MPCQYFSCNEFSYKSLCSLHSVCLLLKKISAWSGFLGLPKRSCAAHLWNQYKYCFQQSSGKRFCCNKYCLPIQNLWSETNLNWNFPLSLPQVTKSLLCCVKLSHGYQSSCCNLPIPVLCLTSAVDLNQEDEETHQQQAKTNAWVSSVAELRKSLLYKNVSNNCAGRK